MIQRIARIVLLGGTADVWPVAALLARELPQHMALHVVEDDAAKTALAATVPLSSDYHTRTGIDCTTLLAECDAALSLGSALEGWTGEGSRLVTAPSGSLPIVGGVALHQLVLRMVAEIGGKLDFVQRFAPYRFAARAAEAGKMALPADAPDSPLAMLGPQASFGRMAYAAMLRSRCTDHCVITRGSVAEVKQNDGGAITGVLLADGSEILGDFFVDCTGDLAAAAGLQSDLAPLPPTSFDRMATVAVKTENRPSMPVYRALDEGLLAITPTGQGQHLAFTCPSVISDEVIRHVIGDGAASAPIMHHAPNTATSTPWRHNLVRLGSASARLGPMLSADMALLQAQALILADCLPVRPQMQAEAAAFNRKHAETLLSITDFVFAPFYLGKRSGELWQGLRLANPSANLQTRIDQFRNRGIVPVFERDHADQQTWIELLAAMGIMPAHHDRRVDAIAEGQATRILQTIRQQLDSMLAQMETQADFLRRFA